MGFFNKFLGRKKKKGEEETELEAEPKPKPEPATKAKAEAKPEPPPEPEAELEAPTESMSDVSASSGRGAVTEASGIVHTGSGGASLRTMSSGSLRAAPNMIQCNSCERDLPVPLASGTTVTCPFCLGRTAYKP